MQDTFCKLMFQFWDGIARIAWERYTSIEEYANRQAAKYYTDYE